jgi:hypothetical protein
MINCIIKPADAQGTGMAGTDRPALAVGLVFKRVAYQSFGKHLPCSTSL